jgi:hypothetical protein
VLFSALTPAQRISDLNTALADFGSSDPDVRVRAFDELLATGAPAAGPIPMQVRALMTNYPAQAERIRTTLIAALDSDATYVRSLESSGHRMPEQFSHYWSNLMWTVADFRDPRAVNGFLAGVDTGGIAVNALADLCPSSVDALIAESTRPPASGRRRASAVMTLADCMKRVQAMASSGQAIAKVRRAAMSAANDRDSKLREAAVKVLFYFRRDPAVRARLAQLGTAGPDRRYPAIREAAASVLAAPLTDHDYYFVMRAVGSRACTIQKGSERPQTDRYIGPEFAPDTARHMLCTHIDTTRTNQDLCWEIQPANACR